jgi:hypothetical protein
MREIRPWVVIACALAACKGQSGSSAKGSGEAETEKMEGEIPVVLGDCAPAGTAFVSGPEPQAFKPEDLQTPATKLYATMADGGDVIAGFSEQNIYGSLLGNEAGEMNGGFGFGRSGFGPGGTGQGWGTIGTGKYGTIGHGGGKDGYGLPGVGYHGPNNGPSVAIGQPTTQVTGTATGDGLDKAIIRRYIKRNIQKIQYCYEKQLLADPKLAGTVTTKFVIAETGKVTKSEADGVHKETASCVARVIEGIEFPKPKGGPVSVTYPFTFRQGNDTATAPSRPAPTPDQVKARQQAIEQARTAGIIVATSEGGIGTLIDRVPTSKPYTPGASSPLAELRILLVDCFRRQNKRYAAVVFDLAPGSIAVHGIEHPAFDKCLADIASQVKVKEPTRCSATFGSADGGSLPAIDITADAITMFGKKVTEPAAVMAGDPEQWWRIESVAKLAEAHVKETIATKEPLTMHGPIAVRPLPETPMKIVTKLVHTLISAGEDPLLTAQRNGTWQLVRNYPLPVVPVPLGTGGSWDGDGYRGLMAEEEPVRLSVLVRKDSVWVGLSRIGEGKRIPFEKLKDELVAQKANKFFADREEIEIAGADDVPYSQVVEAIDIANGAGFRAWSLTSPIGLSAPAK